MTSSIRIRLLVSALAALAVAGVVTGPASAPSTGPVRPVTNLHDA